MIFATSDTHFCHDQPFIWQKRGFSNIDEMDETLVANWNSVVGEDDEVYHLGDVFLNGGENYEKAGAILRRLHGSIRLITGNHDTDRKLDYLRENIPAFVSIQRTEWIRWRKHTVVLSHFPVITGNAGTTSLHSATYCLFGHTHQTVDFTEGLPFACHVGVDSHGLKPVPLDDIMMELRQHCLEMRVFRKEETSGEDAVPSEIFS